MIFEIFPLKESLDEIFTGISPKTFLRLSANFSLRNNFVNIIPNEISMWIKKKINAKIKFVFPTAVLVIGLRNS
jgi:hypothetical protein